jgi:hypothetical protein
VNENGQWPIRATVGHLGETDVDETQGDIQSMGLLYASLFQAPRATYEKIFESSGLIGLTRNSPDLLPPYHRTIAYSLDDATEYKK